VSASRRHRSRRGVRFAAGDAGGESEQMLRLLEMTMDHGITVLLDEAFIDYCLAQSLSQQPPEQRNLIVFRSVTKFFAVPALRVAYAVCNSSKAQVLNRSIAPWPIATLAAHAVRAALLDDAYAEQSRSTNERRRSWLEDQINSLRIQPYSSATNFLLLQFPAEVDVDELWERMIVEEQIVLVPARTQGLAVGHLRVAVRTEQENGRLIDGLKRGLHQSVIMLGRRVSKTSLRGPPCF
jgi:threonine-phosphate decarboxylase